MTIGQSHDKLAVRHVVGSNSTRSEMVKIEPDDSIEEIQNSEEHSVNCGKRKLTKEQEALLQELPTMTKKEEKKVRR